MKIVKPDEHLSKKRFHMKGFKGHIVNKPKKSDYRMDGLTNHERILKK